MRKIGRILPLLTVFGALTVAGCTSSGDTSATLDGGAGAKCTTPAPGCFCVPAWWTNGSCYSGPPGTAGKGACHAGTMTCSSDGVLSACNGQVLPTPETCNGTDDDCDGVVDNAPTGDGGMLDIDAAAFPSVLAEEQITCVTALPGLCAYGTSSCSADAGFECTPTLGPFGLPESCNGLDDDCNGLVDDGLNNLGQCALPGLGDGGALKGECGKGISKCVGGALQCNADYVPTTEVCNGLDDDCDGVVDNNPSSTVPICPPKAGYSDAYCAGTRGCSYSCPYVFTWNGERFAYETTVGGASLVGRREHMTEGRSAAFTPMWIRLNSAAISYRGNSGRARVKILVGDDEVAYLDRARLTVAFHPKGHEVFSTSSMQWNNMSSKDPRQLLALRSAAMRAPVRASWNGDHDVTSALSSEDGHAAPADVRGANAYDLDFGPITNAAQARLIIDGWKMKTIRNLRSGVAHERPHIAVRGGDGKWKKVLDIGTARGDKKAVVVDLSQIEFPMGRYELRLSTGTHEGGHALWMIERVRLTEEAPAALRTIDLRASEAELAFHGVPTFENHDTPERRLDVRDDGRGAFDSDSATLGNFTRYGDVRELLEHADDRLVVMRRGDGVDLVFDGIPAPNEDEASTLLLDVELLYKPRVWLEDGHVTELTERVEPLPHHAMSWYPPREQPRNETAHREYVATWLTRRYEQSLQRRTG